MSAIGQDRLVRKEVALGVVREIAPPEDHIGIREIAPYKDVPTDDVIFSYVVPEVDGLAPARAEDAEAEMATKEDTFGEGRASVIDWAIKDHYDASDVTRYREILKVAEAMGRGTLPLTVGSMLEDYEGKLARHLRTRRRKLDNRMEWLIWQALELGIISYNDGKIKFSVDYTRPANQTAEAPAGGLWSLTTSDPIGDILAMQEFMYDTYGVRMTRAYGSRKAIAAVLNSDRFIARSGMAGATGGAPVDPNYLIDGWGPDAAKAVVERATGVKFREFDSVYRTRAKGSNTTVNNRFLSQNTVVFLPDVNDLAELDDTEIGFAKTLTSPHPEGNFTSGFYEWERSTVDPWGQDFGTGIKAFPVFPYLEYTYTMTVLA